MITLDPNSNKYNWKRLTSLQVGRYAEYYAKMEFTLYGYDVYTTEVDDQGIDFVIRKSDLSYYDVQVKSVRGLNYIFFPKDKFILRKNLIATIVVFCEGKLPYLFLIPSLTWENPNKLFVSRDYAGKKSKPEYGINLSMRNFSLLEEYRFDNVIRSLD